MKSRFIVEESLFKLKGVVGILETMATADDGCVVMELPYTYELLARITREICTELQPIADGEVE